MDCGYEINENFQFANRSRRVTNATDMLIVAAYKDLSASSVAIANKFLVQMHTLWMFFDRYVKKNRLRRSDIISVDEVHLDMDPHYKYALLIPDFYAGAPVDLLSSHRTNGPIESLNRKVKDLKRLGRGFGNFEHFRNRFLYTTRENPVLNDMSDYSPIFSFDDEDQLSYRNRSWQNRQLLSLYFLLFQTLKNLDDPFLFYLSLFNPLYLVKCTIKFI